MRAEDLPVSLIRRPTNKLGPTTGISEIMIERTPGQFETSLIRLNTDHRWCI
jgi:hypothetical protein